MTVSRVAVELPRRFHPEGGRFLIKGYPKDGEHRQFKLGPEIVRKIEQHIAERGIGPDDLLFTMPQLPPRPLRLVAGPATLGLTTPNAAGRRYQHGTLSGYSAGKCRCEHCQGAYASYRARRRAAGQDQPRGHRTVETDGHIPRWWFRTHIWLPAVEAAGLPITVKVHGLRHAHASWLLAGGADIEVVKERLGHASIVTTQKYLNSRVLHQAREKPQVSWSVPAPNGFRSPMADACWPGQAWCRSRWMHDPPVRRVPPASRRDP